jgi:FdhD protein
MTRLHAPAVGSRRLSKLRSSCVPLPVCRVSRTVWSAKDFAEGDRAIPEETAIAFSYAGTTHAVMMASPQDLEDFAYGFSLTERIISSLDEITQLEIVEQEIGIELRLWLAEPHASHFSERRRHMAGPTGCGLCGLESLAQAMRPPARVASDIMFSPREVMRAVASIGPAQVLNRETRAVHAAAFWQPTCGLVALREDVGRHNALDKLAGALARDGVSAGSGMVVLTSRVSVEMVQKAAAIDAPVIAAMSAPTALAVRTAEAAGITLIGIARGDGFEIFTHPDRVTREQVAYVA